METISVRKKLFVRIARDNQEYQKNAIITPEFLRELAKQGIDVYTFLERDWCCPKSNLSLKGVRTDDNVALLEITTFDAWWGSIGKKTRNMIRKAEKSGVEVKLVEPSQELAAGIWKIYNETPIRQGRAFPHYGETLQSVTDNMTKAKKSTFIAAYFNHQLVGFIQIIFGDQIAIISQVLSLQQHWDKALNNSLLAKAVEICAENRNRWLMYGRIGNHPSLDKFKESNGFCKYPVDRYYIPITGIGRFAMFLGLHREFKDILPQLLKDLLIPAFSWMSRNKTMLKHKFKKQSQK